MSYFIRLQVVDLIFYEIFKFSSEIGLVFQLKNVVTDSSAWNCGLR